MEQWFVDVLQVVANSVDRSTACVDKVRKFRVGHSTVVSCDGVDDSDEVFVVSDRFDMFMARNVERLFLLDRFADSFDQVGTTLE